MVIVQRVFILLLFIVTVVTGMVFAMAQQESPMGGAWSAYIYDAEQGALIHVNESATKTSYSLNLPENTRVAGSDIAFTDDGANAAYCALNVNALYEESEAYFILRNIASGRDITKINIGRALACRVDPSSLSPDGTQVAVTVMNKIPNAEQFKDDPRPAASLMIVDLTTGETIEELNTDHPALNALDVMDGAVMFVVREFDESGVTFGLLPWFIGSPDVYKLFHWSPATGEVIDAGVWQHSQARYGDEIAFLSYDESLPVASYDGPISPANQVQVQHGSEAPHGGVPHGGVPHGGVPHTVYVDSENLPLSVEYIKGGEALGVLLLEGMAENSPIPSNKVTLIEITYAEDEEPQTAVIGEYSGFLMYRGTPLGVVVLSQNVNAINTQAEYRLTLIENGEQRLLWSTETRYGAPVYELVWSSGISPESAHEAAQD